jgi:hypothetical protein
VFIRWGHRVGASAAYAYSGWNVDDIAFVGNQIPKLSITTPFAVTEGDGVTNGTVTALPVPSTNLVVSLNSSDTSEIIVPATVTIPAGQSNVTFALTIVDDTEWDGTQTAIITATAAVFGSASNQISVYDNESPPVILAQPASQIVLGGSNVTFTANAIGSAPLHYFWEKNGSPIPGANGSSLTLPGVVRTNSGVYSVLITNLFGSVTSSNGTLLVRVPQQLGTPVLLPGGAFQFGSGDADGGLLQPSDLVNFEVQASTNLLDWTVLPNALSLTNGLLQLQDNGSSNFTTRYYRIVEH